MRLGEIPESNDFWEKVVAQERWREVLGNGTSRRRQKGPS
jgi:hypothetical protein